MILYGRGCCGLSKKCTRAGFASSKEIIPASLLMSVQLDDILGKIEGTKPRSAIGIRSLLAGDVIRLRFGKCFSVPQAQAEGWTSTIISSGTTSIGLH